MPLRSPPTPAAFPWLLCFVCALLPWSPDSSRLLADETTSAEGIEFFEKKIRPVLVDNCYECHSAGSKELGGGLLLDTREGIRRGGESGPAVSPGEEDSLLLQAVRYESYEMPPTGKLADAVVADFERWIRIGAPDPRDGESNSAEASAKEIDFEEARRFWAFRRPTRHTLPPVGDLTWGLRRIDRFVLHRMEAQGLSPAEPADRRTLIRRLSFDLIGLPPTPAEIDRFLEDRSPRAVEHLVDRLLASPHFGERWARRWLDVARYAEDQAHIVGNDQELFYPNAYLYRDWVIEALNRDMPYDRFVRLQLAADFVDPEGSAHLPALGFIGLGPKYYRRRDPVVMAEEWEDRVDVVTRGLLGLTVACARCHDHKYDPIPTEDYYALAGVFAGTRLFNAPLDDQREKEDNGQAKSPADAMHIVKDGDPVDLSVYIRGDVNNKGPREARHFPRILCEGEPASFSQGSGRLELAEAIASRENPLTARVMVNRVWQHLMGAPLVGTPSNLGNLGERPTHPELLDDLSVRFMDSGWSLKWLMREIVLSATYRQSSEMTVRKRQVDPANRLLSRASRRRLDVESWRDGMLAVGGDLDRRIMGPSIDADDPDSRRRTVYSRVSRLELNPMLALFDFPDPNVHAARRSETTTPLQKLFVLNSPFMVRRADRLATRLMEDPRSACDTEGDDSSKRTPSELDRIRSAYRLLYGREPSDREVELGLAFLRQASDDPLEGWRQYAQILLASNEMSFLD